MGFPQSLIFNPRKGIRQGFPLSPLFFLFVDEGLSQAILFKSVGTLKVIRINMKTNITHLLTINDILNFVIKLIEILKNFMVL